CQVTVTPFVLNCAASAGRSAAGIADNARTGTAIRAVTASRLRSGSRKLTRLPIISRKLITCVSKIAVTTVTAIRVAIRSGRNRRQRTYQLRRDGLAAIAPGVFTASTISFETTGDASGLAARGAVKDGCGARMSLICGHSAAAHHVHGGGEKITATPH